MGYSYIIYEWRNDMEISGIIIAVLTAAAFIIALASDINDKSYDAK